MKARGVVLEQENPFVEPAEFYDRSRFGNNGVSTAVDWSTRLPSGLYVPTFNGTTSFIRIATSPSLQFITPLISVSCWFLGDGVMPLGDEGLLAHLDYGINQRAWTLGCSGHLPGDLFALLSDDGTYLAPHRKYYYSSIVVYDATWHFLCFTFDGSTLTLYIDGVEDAGVTKSLDDAITSIHASTADATIGCFLLNNARAGPIPGKIPMCKVENFALTPGQVLQRFEATRSLFGV